MYLGLGGHFGGVGLPQLIANKYSEVNASVALDPFIVDALKICRFPVDRS